ncbi:MULTISPECIES: DUF1932 domain-containing protein [Rhizobium]|uniref:DUF1932 domain-containing protein n=1 Tax=Rhizobium TaxID=379 RepID=UPI00195E856E|nr:MULTISPECIES: DUF1932 domain-containing protein [Rhizobium]MBM7048197.1 NAD(P)-dependent oxidoreductase [Rhizobium lusitanum]
MSTIAFIGFGEAAQAFASGWKTVENNPIETPLAIFDIKVADAASRSALLDACARLAVACTETPRDAITGRTWIFSLVTADRALEAAEMIAPHIDEGALYLDCNSCSPSTKIAAADVIEQTGAHYVDVAVMAPVHPARHRTPLLLAGSEAAKAEGFLTRLGMNARIAGDKVGQASSIKMLRSVMIKGFEALTTECVLAARRAGVEEAVLASLQASDPGIDWKARCAYNLERMMVHGVRRAAEMEEVVVTLRDLGLPDGMAAATVDWQRRIGNLGLSAADLSLTERIDRILGRLLT